MGFVELVLFGPSPTWMHRPRHGSVSMPPHLFECAVGGLAVDTIDDNVGNSNDSSVGRLYFFPNRFSPFNESIDGKASYNRDGNPN